MAKCKIVSHDGDGLYTVDLLPDFSIIETKIAKLTGELVDIDNVEYIEAEANYLDAKALTDAAQVAVDAAIDVYALAPNEVNLAAVTAATVALGEAVNLESQAKIPFDAVKARKLAIEKQLARYNAVNVTPPQVQVWCTDLSDGLKQRSIFAVDDEAGTIELLGNGDNGITIQPHYDEFGLYLNTRDGITTPIASLEPATYFYNRAMTPGWQKWEYEYRPGTITAVAAGGFEVTLDDIKSKEQSDFIPVNDLDDGILTNVPAVYMNCNEQAFDLADHVIVKTEYSSVATGRVRTDTVIGFVDNPKPCNINGFNYHPFVIGGTAPGFHDWQNLQPTWSMRTPVLSDVITDGGDVVDWKGYLTDGTKILAQWEHQGDFIYIDGIKMAAVPSFTLSYATGDPFTGGSNIANGFIAAWVTKDNQYIYGITYEQVSRSRHVVRKTNVLELTGGAYNAGTLPDGWEVSAALGPTSFTDFTLQGTVYMNESGTEGRAMDLWVHGAARTPQLSPGIGTWNLSPSSYDAFWTEESVLTITTPSAATIGAAGITCSYLGKQGDFIYEEGNGEIYSEQSGAFACNLPGEYYWGYTENKETATVTYSGSERKIVGYEGDVAGYVWLDGVGANTIIRTWTQTGSCNTSPEYDLTETRSRVATAAGFGREYSSDFASWTVPYDLEIYLQDSLVYLDPFTGSQTLTEVQEFYHDDGSVSGDVNNIVYEHLWDENYSKFTWDQTGPFSVAPDTPTGTVGAGQTITYKFDMELGATEINFSRVFLNTPFATVAGHTGDRQNPSSQLATFAGTGPPAPTDIISTVPQASFKYNITGVIRTRTQTSSMDYFQYAKDHAGNYIASYEHRYNVPETTEYGDYLDGGDIGTLDELDNGTGTKYINPHVAN